MQQTLQKIKEANPKEIRKRLRVSFKGEDGLDAGGVTKEVSARIPQFSNSLPPVLSAMYSLLTCCEQNLVFPTPKRTVI